MLFVVLGGRVYRHVVCCTWWPSIQTCGLLYLVAEYIDMLFVVLGGRVYRHVVCCTWWQSI